jgi:hypothetical protein
MFSFELTCPNCGWRTVCGLADAASRLRLNGLLRREPNPDEGIVAQLIVESAPRMTCPVCKETQLVARPSEEAAGNDGNWQAAVLCDVCRRPIAPERLEAIPGAKRCAACQGKTEAGTIDDVDPDYCPRCGAPTEVRMSRGIGITRYKRFCTGNPPCRL